MPSVKAAQMQARTDHPRTDQATISVVIPTLNAGQTLGRTIAALEEAREGALIGRVIVSDGGSGDDTCDVAREHGALVLRGAPGRGGQLVRGAGVASGDWLLFLHADTLLGQGWSRTVAAHLSRPDRAGVFRLRFDDDSRPARAVGAWANFRTRAFGLPYGDQGLLISKSLYQQVGGFADIPLMEDVDMARKLRGRIDLLDAVALTSAQRFQAEGWAVRGGKNLMLLTRFLLGADPVELDNRYRKARDQASRN